MILGNVCTRRCGFCAVETGRPDLLSESEPERVAAAASEMGLEYVVITSVARDEMADEGAAHFAKTIRAVKEKIPCVRVEVLTPDFHARRELIGAVVEAGPDVYNHNLETVERLQKKVRPQAAYERSLAVIETVKDLDPHMTTKSGLMLGLGEELGEVVQSARDLLSAGCDILTLGQYLRPSADHWQVARFIEPEVFEDLAADFRAMGFKRVFAGPYVRSSYHAGEIASASRSGKDYD